MIDDQIVGARGVGDADILDRQRDLAEGVARRWGAEIEILADHVAHDPFEIDVLRLGRGGDRAVAQHHRVVGDLQRLFEMVRDIDDGDAATGEVANDLEQHAHLGRAQRRGRLVHDEDAGVHRQSARDLDDLLLAEPQVLDAR
jgi:hypothetical protein